MALKLGSAGLHQIDLPRLCCFAVSQYIGQHDFCQSVARISGQYSYGCGKETKADWVGDPLCVDWIGGPLCPTQSTHSADTVDLTLITIQYFSPQLYSVFYRELRV